MLQRVIPALLLSALICLIVPAASQACTCSQQPPGACQGVHTGDTIFLGTVTDIGTASLVAESPSSSAQAPADSASGNSAADASDTSSANSSNPPITRYHFHIDEKFAGSDSAEIDIFSGGDDGDCGYHFEKGQQYIVFTEQGNDGRLYATICNGTRPANDGLALLPQLRAMRDGERVASVFGVLRRADPPFLAPPGDPVDPLPDISLKLRSRYDRFSTSTGPGGVFTFYDVHAGEYSITANLPRGMVLTQKTLAGGLPPFKIPNGACYEYDMDALPTGHIRGSVLGPDGKPLKLASVELYRAGEYSDSKPGLWGFQGAKGSFDFDHIGQGEYILVFNRTNRRDPNAPFPRAFYPGVPTAEDSKPITLKDGQQFLKANIRLREGYPIRRFQVHVKWEHGRPPGNVTVMAKADDGSANPSAVKVADGLFEFTLLDSGRYTISAWEDLDPARATSRRNGPACTVPARIDAGPVTVEASDPGITDVTLVLATPDCTTE